MVLGSGALRDATRPGEWGRAESGRDGGVDLSLVWPQAPQGVE